VAIREWQVRAAERWAKRARLAFEEARETMRRRPNRCRGCDKELLQGGRGRPPEWCSECRGGPKYRAHKNALALTSYHKCREQDKKAREEAERESH
jgi:hypothetical protein